MAKTAAVKSPPKLKPKRTARNGAAGPKPKIFKVNYREDRKPMSLEEAILEMDSDSTISSIRTLARIVLSVLVRRH